MTRRERDQSLTDWLHPELVNHERVTVQKYEEKSFKRGLLEDEIPVPVVDKLGPYIVSAS